MAAGHGTCTTFWSTFKEACLTRKRLCVLINSIGPKRSPKRQQGGVVNFLQLRLALLEATTNDNLVHHATRTIFSKNKSILVLPFVNNSFALNSLYSDWCYDPEDASLFFPVIPGKSLGASLQDSKFTSWKNNSLPPWSESYGAPYPEHLCFRCLLGDICIPEQAALKMFLSPFIVGLLEASILRQ